MSSPASDQTRQSHERYQVSMSKLKLFALIVVIAAVGTGAFFLLTWEIPPPTSKVEKVIPNERLPR